MRKSARRNRWANENACFGNSYASVADTIPRDALPMKNPFSRS
jgi:hypothetical protein